MADKTYKLNISKSDGSFSDSVQFTIPQREGTYKIEFELSNGNKVNAGNITVSPVEKTYKAEFKLSDGNTIDGGTFTTPVVLPEWHVVWEGSEHLHLTRSSPSKQSTFVTNGKQTRITGYATSANFNNINFNAVELSTTKVGLVYESSQDGDWFYSISVDGCITNDGKIEISGLSDGTNMSTGQLKNFSTDVYITKIEQLY